MAKLKNYRYYPKPGNAWNPLKAYPRNHDCFCGSELKAKKCCLPKVQEYCPAKTAQDLEKNWDKIIAGLHLVELTFDEPETVTSPPTSLDEMHDNAVNEADQKRIAE